MTKIFTLLLALAATFATTSAASQCIPETQYKNWEVWAMDQSPSVDPTNSSQQLEYGGGIYILSSDQALGKDTKKKPFFIDLANETTTLCRESTGTTPVVPHLIWFNRDQTHASVSFLGTGHVVIFEAHTRKPVSCLMMPINPATNQSGVHAVIPTYDEKYYLVANSFGKAAHKISTDFKNNKFELVDTLDVVSCKTISGLPCEGPARPNNIVPCVFELNQTETNNLAFVSLVGGGDYFT
ncbi:hypothetical protein NQZ79_g6239 [Umbelopsis isabellina]|nr:hypothetical protein NQZ79_g6239 [Umbelopsis isabellina]